MSALLAWGLGPIQGGTNSSLDFTPSNVLTRLPLGRIIAEHSLLQNLRLALAEVSDAQDRNGVRRGQREEGDEQDADQDGEDALDLNLELGHDNREPENVKTNMLTKNIHCHPPSPQTPLICKLAQG